MLLILDYSISKVDMFIGIIVVIYSELFGLFEKNPNIYYEGSTYGEKKSPSYIKKILNFNSNFSYCSFLNLYLGHSQI